MLDEVKARGQVADEDFPKVFGRISFFVNAGVRFIEEHAKLRAMGEMWEEIGRNRYGVTEPKFLRLRYGVQVNSLGLTESQPENNVPRIVLEALAVTLGRDARARAIQLPAWNEALGLPRPWDQQWSLRIQQILAYETDLLDYPDIFEGSKVMDGLVDELVEGARGRDEDRRRAGRRGRGGPLHEGAAGRVAPRADRQDRARRDQRRRPEQFTETEDSPLTAGEPTAASSPPTPRSSASGSQALEEWRPSATRPRSTRRSRSSPRPPRDESANIMPATIEAAKAGATTGEWAGTLREVFGDYRAPTGVSEARGGGAVNGDLLGRGPRAGRRGLRGDRPPLRILVGKPGLDGHSNGAEQIAVRARDVGMEVIYQGIRLTPEQIAELGHRGGRRRGRPLDPLRLAPRARPRVVELLREQGVDMPVVVGGIIPAADAAAMREAGVAGVYTPKDFEINRIMGDIVELVAERHRGRPAGLMNDPELNGDRSSWLRCYRCWATDLEVQLHYDAILRDRPRDRRARRSASTRSRRPSSSACAACTTSPT